MRRVGRALLLLLATLGGSVVAEETALAGDASCAFAIIDVQPAEAGVTVAARAFALAPLDVEAEMVIERKGKSGTVSTRQGRHLSLQPGTVEDIARTGVNFNDGDIIAVTVLLKRDGVVLAESTMSAGR